MTVLAIAGNRTGQRVDTKATEPESLKQLIAHGHHPQHPDIASIAVGMPVGSTGHSGPYGKSPGPVRRGRPPPIRASVLAGSERAGAALKVVAAKGVDDVADVVGADIEVRDETQFSLACNDDAAIAEELL